MKSSSALQQNTRMTETASSEVEFTPAPNELQIGEHVQYRPSVVGGHQQ